MKTKLLILTLFLTNLLLGQNSNTVISFTGNGLVYFDYKDFVENAINSVEAYRFRINKRGKPKKDSTRLFVQVFNADSNRINGINCNLNYQSHGPAFLTRYRFQKQFDETGRIIKITEQPLDQNRRKEYGDICFEVNINEKYFYYNKKGLLSREVTNIIKNSYSISKYTKDTFHLRSIHPKIYDYKYDDMGREIENYFTDDSTRYLKTNIYTPDSNSVNCFYCDPRYLNGSKKYGQNGKLSRWTWYTSEGEIHTKKYYYYDDLDRIKRRVDSTGWYLMKYSDENPKLESITEYFYKDSTLWKVIKTIDQWQNEQEYNPEGELISNCFRNGSKNQGCSTYSYQYEGNKILKMTKTFSNGDILKVINSFNERGWLEEEKQFKNDKLISLVRYIYWVRDKDGAQKRL